MSPRAGPAPKVAPACTRRTRGFARQNFQFIRRIYAPAEGRTEKGEGRNDAG